jgi:hypothetical protein
MIACRLEGIGTADRPRYHELMTKLRSAARGRIELESGFEFGLDASRISLAETAEWMSLERLCCPFLTLELSTSGESDGWTLRLTGPDGVKPLLLAEFPG